MADSQFKSWQVPAAALAENIRLDWLNSATEEGNAWLKSQRGYYDWRKALDTISGTLSDNQIPSYRSHISTNHLKKNVRTITGTLSNLKPIWSYASDNKAFASQAHMMNLTNKAWYLEAFADRSINRALKWAAVSSSGWVRPVYRREMAGTGRGNVALMTYGGSCVLPVQLPSSGDFQQAYAATLLDEMPIWMAHAMFPLYQDKLSPTSSGYWYSNEIRRSSKGNLWQRMWGQTRNSQATGLSDLMCPIRYTYVNDLTLNRTGQTIPMGEPGTSWFYSVPSIGSDIPMGLDPKSGTALTRKATESDARLYPHRRLLISSESCIMYDGPAFDWHGRLPLIPFQLDSWPWEPLGFSVVRDGYQIQISRDTIWRGIIDKLVVQNDLPLAYDINAVTKKEASSFDPMQPRGRAGFDGMGTDKPFVSPVPPEMYLVKPEQFQADESLKSMMDEQHAIKDVMALAKARLAGDDIEKVMEANGPIIEDMSREMEAPMREIGEQVKYLILQYFTTPRVMQYVGADNMSIQTFDYDPSSLVPSHLPGEDSAGESVYTKPQRARIFADNLRFTITPHSLHEFTQTAYKLGLTVLKKAGVDIDSQTIAEAWSIPNYGTIDGATVRDRVKTEQEEKLIFAARMQELGVSLSGAGSGTPPGAPAPGKSAPEGRPSSGGQSPALKQKTDGRPTVTTSEGGGRVV